MEIGDQVFKLAPNYKPRLSVVMFQRMHLPVPWIGCEFLSMQTFAIDAEGCLGFCNNVAGYAGCPPGPEVVADLGEVSFNEALRRQIQIVARFQQDKVEAIEKGSISDRDVIFPCWYCAKYFNKTAWLKQFPGHPWNEWDGTEPVERDLRIGGKA